MIRNTLSVKSAPASSLCLGFLAKPAFAITVDISPDHDLLT